MAGMEPFTNCLAEIELQCVGGGLGYIYIRSHKRGPVCHD